MAGRADNSENYRYGFNGMEKDNEFTNSTSHYDFGARIYDSRLGRWLAVDPLFINFPNYSDYVANANNPVYFIDLKGEKFTGYVARLYYKSIMGQIDNYLALNPNDADVLDLKNLLQRMEDLDVSISVKLVDRRLTSEEYSRGVKNGNITYDNNVNQIVLNIYDIFVQSGASWERKSYENDHLQHFVHELEHARQLIDKEIALADHDDDGIYDRGQYSYDYTDEINAFTMQNKFVSMSRKPIPVEKQLNTPNYNRLKMTNPGPENLTDFERSSNFIHGENIKTNSQLATDNKHGSGIYLAEEDRQLIENITNQIIEE
jgi:RHS repeat-associated protein